MADMWDVVETHIMRLYGYAAVFIKVVRVVVETLPAASRHRAVH